MPTLRPILFPAPLTVALFPAVGGAVTSTQTPTQLVLDLEDYAALPISGELDGENTRGQLARVNYLRDEPGGRRFFVNDLNGPLYSRLPLCLVRTQTW